MTLKRTDAYAEESDLLLIRQAGARSGVSEAETIREGIHRIAPAHRVGDEPFVSGEETFDLGGPVAEDEIGAAVTRGHDERERRISPGARLHRDRKTGPGVFGMPEEEAVAEVRAPHCG